MTGYTVHTGASKKFVSGWDRVFGGKASGKSQTGEAKASGRKSKSTGGGKRSK
jgi:hypothetical protein